MKVVVVSGNIASGKSSVLKELERRGFRVFQEKVDSWIPFLEHVYGERTDWSHTLGLQMRIVADQAERLRQLRAEESEDVVFFERWFDESRDVFVEYDKANAAPHELELWKDLARLTGVDAFEPSAYVYLRACPQVSFTRMQSRSLDRECEKGVPFEYLRGLHELYEEWAAHRATHSVQVDTITVKQIADSIEAFVSELTGGSTPPLQAGSPSV